MLLLEGYLKQLWIDRDSAARGGPPWAIRVTNGRGRAVTFNALAWRLRPSPGQLRGAGGPGEGPLLPGGPYYWCETSMAIDADISVSWDGGRGALTGCKLANLFTANSGKGPPAGAP